MLQWVSGRFKKGDQIQTSNGNKCRKSIKSVEFSNKPFNSLTLDKKTGYVGIGIPNSNAVHPLTIGGKLGIQGTRQHGQYLPSQNKAPAIILSNSFEAKEINGLQMKLDSSPKKNRLILTDIDLGGAHTAFNKKALNSFTSFNIKSIKRMKNGTIVLRPSKELITKLD